MRSATLIALLAAIALGLAGCGGSEVVGALPETVVGTVPQATTAGPSTTLKGDAAAGKDLYASKGCGSCHTLAAAGSSGAVGPNLDESKPAVRPRRRPRHERPGCDAAVQGPALRARDRRRRVLRGRVRRQLILPAGFPRRVEAFACDLDRTLIAEDVELRPRTIAAIRAARAAGIRVIVVTGRMFRSVRPYLDRAGIEEPVVCYQGAAVVEPGSGRFLLHEPIPLEAAREAIAAVEAEGHPLNCYVDDELYVAEDTALVARRTRTSSTSR